MSTAIIEYEAPAEGRVLLACRDCGQLVSDPQGTAEWVVATRAEIRLSADLVHQAEKSQRFAMAVCDDCRARRARAEQIMDRFAFIRLRIGSREIAVERMDGALAVIDALAMPDLDDASLRDVTLALKNLAPAGIGVRWESRFAPVTRLGAAEHQTAASRWSHLSEEEWTELRSAYARFLAAKTFRGGRVPPPEAGEWHAAARGCLLCGVSHVAIKSRDERPWGEIQSCPPDLLRGKGSPEPVWGFLCPDCRRAMARQGVQSLGTNALDATLGDFLEVSVADPWEIVGLDQQRLKFLHSLRAWAVTGREPNERPWQHLEPLDAVRQLLGQF